MLAGQGSAQGMTARSAGVSRLGCPSFKEKEVALAARHLLDPPLALDVRMPPLHPKRSANLQALAAMHGSLFAGQALYTLLPVPCERSLVSFSLFLCRFRLVMALTSNRLADRSQAHGFTLALWAHRSCYPT